jgi:hypothetical protein
MIHDKNQTSFSLESDTLENANSNDWLEKGDRGEFLASQQKHFVI